MPYLGYKRAKMNLWWWLASAWGEEKREEAEKSQKKPKEKKRNRLAFSLGSLYLGREGKSAKSRFWVWKGRKRELVEV